MGSAREPVYHEEVCTKCTGVGVIDTVDWGPELCNSCGLIEYECACPVHGDRRFDTMHKVQAESDAYRLRRALTRRKLWKAFWAWVGI